MARKGEQVAAAPVPRYGNLTVAGRVGRTIHLETTWRVVCGCGWETVADQRPIKGGGTRCPKCNPFRHYAVEQDAKAIRAALPAGYAKIMRKTGLDRQQAERRIKAMRANGWCHVGDWKRPDAQGLFNPIFHAGPGKDAPCTLKPVPLNKIKRKYEQRVKKAIKKAQETGVVDPRYVRHIRRKQADSTVQEARSKPQNPFSALGL